MSVLDRMLVRFCDKINSLNIDKSRKERAVEDFYNWAKEKLGNDYIDKSVEISSFFDSDIRIKKWQDYYQKKPIDCPPIEWPLFKASDFADKSEYGRTPLHNAIIDNDLDMVKKLIDEGIDINMKDNGGNTAFELGVLENRDDIIDWMIENGHNT